MSIQIENLYHAYSRKAAPAVDGLSITIGTGDLYVLLGPSGCGKTTTMRCVAGLERPSRGSITVNGKKLLDTSQNIYVPPHKRQIGMVFQSYAIWPHRTVIENVAFPLKMQRLSRKSAYDRARPILEKVGLAGYEERRASLLSGGQMQRVALARSIAMRPSVLLFDEPLSNLDARLRETLRFELRSLQQEYGFTSIYVTHDQAEALALGDEIAVMHDGRIVQRGGPTDLYHRPASRFVAEFLGVGNLLPAQVIATSVGTARARLDAGGTEVLATSKANVGDRVIACVREEDVALEEGEQSGPGQLSGVVDVASFQGSEVRYQCVTDGGVRIRSSMPSSGPRFAAGTRVTMRIRQDAVSLVAADEPAH